MTMLLGKLSIFHLSWTTIVLVYIASLLCFLLLDPDPSYFWEAIQILGATVVMLSTTAYVPLIHFIISIIRFSALRKFTLHNLYLLQNTRAVLSFLPLLLSIQICLSLPFTYTLLSRRLLISLLIPTLVSVCLHAVLGLCLACIRPARSIEDILDILLAAPYQEITTVVASESVFGRLWYAAVRLLNVFLALSALGLCFKTTLSFDAQEEMEWWTKRWATSSTISMQMYTIPGEAVLMICSKCTTSCRKVYVLTKAIKSKVVHGSGRDDADQSMS